MVSIPSEILQYKLNIDLLSIFLIV
jgi:hypothetical protein